MAAAPATLFPLAPIQQPCRSPIIQTGWPLLLFLHGAGESGHDLNKVKIHGPPKLIEAGKNFPMIVVSPQSPRMGWDVPTLNALLDEIVATGPPRELLSGLTQHANDNMANIDKKIAEAQELYTYFCENVVRHLVEE